MTSPIVPNIKSMTSREIAELTGKRHDHVIRDIETMLIELEIDLPKFGSIYKDSYGRTNMPAEIAMHDAAWDAYQYELSFEGFLRKKTTDTPAVN